MNRSFVIWENLLERITRNPEWENIILGTGKQARDLQKKLCLLNLEAPFLVGDRDDPENGVIHYSRIAELDTVERYRFILCYDVDEWVLMAPTHSVMFERLGIASFNHPRVILLTRGAIIGERAGEALTDANIHNVFLRDGRPYAVYGEEHKNQFAIHIFGTCHASGLAQNAQYSFPELLHEQLRQTGFEAAVYTWAHPGETTADCLLQFLRDAIHFRKDLLIVEKGVGDFNSLHIAHYNLSPVHVGIYEHELVGRLRDAYTGNIGGGLNHNTDAISVWAAHHRIFLALAKQASIVFWNIIPPTGSSQPEKQAQKLLGLSPGYLSRIRKRKEAAIAAVNGKCVKDYTDSFSDVDNIFEMYADITHLTVKGNEIIAKRCANDILQAFGSGINKNCEVT